MPTIRLTVAQATIRFLAAQRSERDGVEHRLIEGCFGIFGHGNVAGLGQALLEQELHRPGTLTYYQSRNEQAMVHASTAFARMRNRLSTLACTSSVGPGATNMLTGAALATINRLPVLLLPGDVFATRAPDPVLQQLEHPVERDTSVNDAFRPLSRFFDRVMRPEQLPAALLGAMRTLTDPVDTGAVTVCIPQDVQAEAYDWPEEFFATRVWHVSRPRPDVNALARATAVIRTAKRPLIVAGGGVIYSEATEALRVLVEATGIPVGETQAGKGSLAFNHPQSVGAIGATGSTAANALARDADLVIGIGTRYSDFTTASRTAFQNPDVKFVNVNATSFDAAKHAGTQVVGDARETIVLLTEALTGWTVPPDYAERVRDLASAWDETVERAYHLGHGPIPAQSEIIGVVNDVSGPRDVVVCAAGSMPGDLHKLWRTRDPKGYHVEYGYSCMGYEIAGALGVKMARPEAEVIAMVGDGSYLMLNSEIATSVMLGQKLIVVVLDNRGYGCIQRLQLASGSPRFNNLLDDCGPTPPAIDFAAHAASLGAGAVHVKDIAELKAAMKSARAATTTQVVVIDTTPWRTTDDGGAWWEVAIPEVSPREEVRSARRQYEGGKRGQQP